MGGLSPERGFQSRDCWHEDTQLYGAILPKELTNEDIRNSESYKEYYAIASGEVPPKTKASVHKKKADSDTTPKEKPPTDPKDKRVKQTGKMTGSGKQKQPATGLETLSEIALTETEQLKIATKRSQIQTLNSQASGSGDGVDILSKVPDEQVHEKTCTDEGAGDKPEVPNVPEHHSSNKSDDDGDNITHPKLSTFSTDDQEENNDEEEQEEDDEDEEEISDQVKDGEEDKEGDVTNVNLEGGDVDMTEADTTKDTEDAHFISPTTDEGIDSILTPHTESTTLVNVPISVATETPTTTTTIPTLYFPVTQSSQQTPVTTTTTTNPSTTPLPIPNFASVFGFNQRMKEAVDVAIQLKSNKLREEAQAENQEFLNSLDSNMQKIIKDQVKTQTSKIKSKVEKYVTESLGAEVLIRSTNQPQTSYGIASSLLELELKRILMDKMEENKSIDRISILEKSYNALVEAYNTDKDLVSSYGDVLIIPTTRDDKDKDEEPSAGSNRGTKRWRPGKEAESSKEPTRDDDVIPAREVHDERQWHPPTSLTPDREWHLTKTASSTNLILDARYALNVALRMYTRRIVIQERVEDLQLAVKSYQKKINLTKTRHNTPDLRKITPYTGYPDVQGIIYQDELSRNRLMRTDELHKFSDGTLNHVRTTLNDIATWKQWIILPRDDGVPQDKRIASRVMISAIDRSSRSKVMRSLENLFYTSAGNPVKEILLKLNLPDHRILKDGGEGFPAQKRRISDRHRCIRNHHAVLFSRYRNVPSKQTTRISIFTVNTLSITRMFWQDLKDNAYDS
ncbi:hypothetical protein Tco_1043158 [Tanacetum coccineum]|uniref:Uncharacterized protein n=1 Tax=Tanacetum coccineum TaxID=301880 RepID=A0ABQ5GNU4_9ASTR